MTDRPYILFCESPLRAGSVDEDFEEELIAAARAGFSTLLFNFEDLTGVDRIPHATRRIQRLDRPAMVIYRGWMLTPQQYAILYEDLLSKNLQLINTTVEYQNCHYLPDSLRFIESNTPKTIFEKLEGIDSINRLIARAAAFGKSPAVIKDYVKSEKHDWETACFVPDASDAGKLRQSVDRTIDRTPWQISE